MKPKRFTNRFTEQQSRALKEAEELRIRAEVLQFGVARALDGCGGGNDYLKGVFKVFQEVIDLRETVEGVEAGVYQQISKPKLKAAAK